MMDPSVPVEDVMAVFNIYSMIVDRLDMAIRKMDIDGDPVGCLDDHRHLADGEDNGICRQT